MESLILLLLSCFPMYLVGKLLYLPFTFEKKKVVVKDYKLNKEKLLFKSEILIYKDLEF